jgi:undecaprenyl-diphosphatase
MNFIDTTILGIVEGLTEFLPISSTGHLILTGHLLKVTGNAASTFEIVIQLGAILAVVFLYRDRFKLLFKPNQDQAFSGLRGWQLLALTSLPASVLGLLFHHAIKDHLFGPTPVLWALGIGGIAIIIVEQLRFKPTTESLNGLSMKQAFTIGLFQCMALWPGVSRAAATIVGGLFSGLDRRLAAEYSFLAAVPIMFMATGYELYKSMDTLSANDLAFLGLGFVIAFISAIFAVKFFIQLLQRSTLTPFGIYRIAIALLFFWVMKGA